MTNEDRLAAEGQGLAMQGEARAAAAQQSGEHDVVQRLGENAESLRAMAAELEQTRAEMDRTRAEAERIAASVRETREAVRRTQQRVRRKR